MFEESRNRVNSMALIHQKLYQSKDLALINFKEYLQSLTQEIAATYNRPEIQLLVVMEPGLALDVNAGIPCGLIANELISNAFKHAFPEGRKGSIQVGLHCEGEDIFVLTIADDGIGFPPGLDFRNTPSLGLQLVNVLTGQLHGTIDLNTEQETSFRIRFPASQQAGDKHNG
jgi:two-component sensor histidine kinase